MAVHEGVILQMHETDNVATALTSIPADAECTVRSGAGTETVHVHDQIPFGHKFAVRAIQEGQEVRKYGQVIGRATANIAVGEHVHRHNVRSDRAVGKTGAAPETKESHS